MSEQNSMLAAVHAATQPDAVALPGNAAVTPQDLAAAATAAAASVRQEATSQATATANVAAAAIVEMCVAAGVPAMAATLIKEGLSAETAKARVDGAKEIKAAVDLASKSVKGIDAGQADRYIAAGMTIEAVRADLFTKMAALQSPEIVSGHQAGPEKTASTMWDKAVAKVNDRLPRAAAA